MMLTLSNQLYFRIMRAMKSLRRTFLLIVLILVLAVIVELITPLRQLTDYLNQNPQPYKAVTIGTSVIGWILMAGVIAYGIWSHGKPMTDDESLEFTENGEASPTIYRSFRGQTKGRGFRTEVTFKEIKEAWQNGDWSNPEWLPIFLGLLAMIFIAFGMFGFFFVIGEPIVKLVCAGALVYTVVRTAWAFWKI